MKSAKPGGNTSGVELQDVSARGLWLLVDQRELYLAFKEFPWFRNATVGQLAAIERLSPEHLRWPELDIDLTLDAIEHPEKYPLVSGG